MYLTRPTVMAVLKDIGSVDRFTIALDYMSEEVVAGTTGDQPTTELSALRRHGRPWGFGLNDLGALAAEAGLLVTDVVRLQSSTARIGRTGPWIWSSTGTTSCARSTKALKLYFHKVISCIMQRLLFPDG